MLPQVCSATRTGSPLMVLAAIYEHHAAVTLCLKRVMVGNHLFKELVDCHFRFSDGRKSGSRGAILKVLSDMRFGPGCHGLSLAWPSLLCHLPTGSNPEMPRSRGGPRRTEVALAKTSEPFDTSFVRQYEWST